jgi:hypothetical protein
VRSFPAPAEKEVAMKTLFRAALALAFAVSASAALARSSAEERELFGNEGLTQAEASASTSTAETYSTSTEMPAEGPETRASFDDGGMSGQASDPDERSAGSEDRSQLDLAHDGGG